MQNKQCGLFGVMILFFSAAYSQGTNKRQTKKQRNFMYNTEIWSSCLKNEKMYFFTLVSTFLQQEIKYGYEQNAGYFIITPTNKSPGNPFRAIKIKRRLFHVLCRT
jgi:hypothetical protein